MKKYYKLLLTSLCFIMIIALLSIVYGLIVHQIFTLRYIFGANFLLGAIVILTGLVILFVPSVLVKKGRKLLDDHSTHIERSFEEREQRQHKAREIIWVGIFNIVLSGLIQVLLSMII